MEKRHEEFGKKGYKMDGMASPSEANLSRGKKETYANVVGRRAILACFWRGSGGA